MTTPLHDVSQLSRTERGYFIAFVATLTAATMNLANRMAVSEYTTDPWGIAFLQMALGGLALFLAGGGLRRTGRGLATLRHTHTWVIGFVRVVHVLLVVFSLQQLTATEVCFLVSMQLPMGVCMAWIFLNRKPKPSQIPGLLLVLGGLIYMIVHTPGGFANTGVLLVVGISLLWAIEALIVETHPEIQEESTHRARFRATGIVMMITGLIFLCSAFIIGTLPFSEGLLGSRLQYLVPDVSLLLRPETLIIGALIGIFARAPRIYLEFLSIKVMKSENYFMVTTLQPFAVLALEALFQSAGLIDMTGFETTDLIGGIIITVGAMLMLISRIRHEHKKMETDAWENHPLFGQNPFFKDKEKN